MQKRLKALFYGAAGVGKTTASIQFIKPYLIDTERGAENDQYTALLKNQHGAIFQSCDFDDIITEVKTLLTEKHPYKTLIIDPLTTVYHQLIDQATYRVGTEFGRHYSEANKHLKRLLSLLLRLDMNVIITAHAKNEYGDHMTILGQTFDCYKKLDYLFDLVIEIQKCGKERVGMVRKTRIQSFNELETFPFSYDTIAEKYGQDQLERSVTLEALANATQITELKRLIKLLTVPDTTMNKWLDKAQASTFDDMPAHAIQSCIDLLNKKIAA